jgi:hypothetical protein
MYRCVRQNICVDVTFDLDPVTMSPNCIIFPFRSIIPKWLKIFGWYLVGGCIRGQRCVARKINVDATLTQNCIIIPFRSVSSKRMKIFGWYWVGGCIGGQRCVIRKKRVDATFDLDPVTLKPKFPSAIYLLKECATLHITYVFDLTYFSRSLR